jgi:ParB family chromosome partitioning protein
VPPKKRRKKAESQSRGLTPAQVGAGSPTAPAEALRQAVEDDGGQVLAVFRDPLGGNWQILAALPIDKVQPTPYQRDLSESHVKRLTAVIDALDRFLDPIVAVRGAEGGYWTPNGNHRLAAVRNLGGRSILALVLADPEVAYKILALNTEKAHNLREKSLEVIRMARDLASRRDAKETDFALEFEEPGFLTLGACYEKNGRFAGGAYHPVLKRIDDFLDEPLSRSLKTREERAGKLLALDEAVVAAMKALKERGFDSPYLRPFVVARINPLRFVKSEKGSRPDFDATLEKMQSAAEKFKAGSVKPEHLARAGGAPDE